MSVKKNEKSLARLARNVGRIARGVGAISGGVMIVALVMMLMQKNISLLPEHVTGYGATVCGLYGAGIGFYLGYILQREIVQPVSNYKGEALESERVEACRNQVVGLLVMLGIGIAIMTTLAFGGVGKFGWILGVYYVQSVVLICGGVLVERALKKARGW
ncbi:hypothetical protein IKF15_02460 [Candidatus Saccharibacteria bacterium]|nr:hypothetical protein [Candidatus Saccharibacteria bacterium]